MDKFYVGAKVVCVRSHPQGQYYFKGKIYIIESIRKGKCGCIDSVELDLGIPYGEGWQLPKNMICDICNAEYDSSGNIMWCDAPDFRLIEPDTELSETRSDEILDLINANA